MVRGAPCGHVMISTYPEPSLCSCAMIGREVAGPVGVAYVLSSLKLPISSKQQRHAAVRPARPLLPKILSAQDRCSTHLSPER